MFYIMNLLYIVVINYKIVVKLTTKTTTFI
jgi:hypothetical protein